MTLESLDEVGGKDLRVTVKLRNNHLVSRRESLGVAQYEMAKLIGVSVMGYGQMERLEYFPLERPWRSSMSELDVLAGSEDTWVWKAAASRVAQYYAVSELVLWPRQLLLTIANLGYTEQEMVLSSNEAAALMARQPILPASTVEPGHHRELADLRKELLKGINKIPEGFRQILLLRYGLDGEDPMTMVEVQDRLLSQGRELSRERIRQHEKEGLRELYRVAGDFEYWRYLDFDFDRDEENYYMAPGQEGD